jgi:hypothetical protein
MVHFLRWSIRERVERVTTRMNCDCDIRRLLLVCYGTRVESRTKGSLHYWATYVVMVHFLRGSIIHTRKSWKSDYLDELWLLHECHSRMNCDCDISNILSVIPSQRVYIVVHFVRGKIVAWGEKALLYCIIWMNRRDCCMSIKIVP